MKSGCSGPNISDQQCARAFNYLSENYNLNVMDLARLMCILWTGFADAAIGCWNAKFTYIRRKTRTKSRRR